MRDADGIPPWERSQFERRAAGWGIAFERRYGIPHGSALLVCERSAACIYLSPSTADGLLAGDDSAMWGAISRQALHMGEPALISLPTFGGDCGLQPLPSALLSHAYAARQRAASFTPWESYSSDWERESGAEYWAGRQTTYQWHISNRVPKIRWLDTLRDQLVQTLLSQASRSTNPVQRSAALVAERSGDYVLLRNIRGGRRGAYRGGLRLLTLADEIERPAAVQTLSTVGIDVPFRDEPGWVNASVEPAQRGWWTVMWRGSIAGVPVEAQLAWFHSQTHELRVFDAALNSGVERLIRRNGFTPQSVNVLNHPSDPETLFGFDLIAALEAAPRHKPRHLSPEAAALLPAEYARVIETLWNPARDQSIPRGLFTQKTWDEAYNSTMVEEKRATGKPCKLCDSRVDRGDASKYCTACRKDAASGILFDDGEDYAWTESTHWALKTLADKEFGGPPALAQLKKLPTAGTAADLLMLCRMLAVRKGKTDLGAARRVKGWTDWLASAGLLAEGIRTTRGIITTAKDGHLCRSLFEKQIDDFLYDNGIEHETEPAYPYDPQMNTTGYRADWKLADGTFIEALGFPENAQYMAKAEHKLALGMRHGIRVVTITQLDLPSIESVLQEWLPPEGARPRSRPVMPRKKAPAKTSKGGASGTSASVNNGRNAANDQTRAERLERARRAVELQSTGLARNEIAETLGFSQEVIVSLLRDGKFYADTSTDPRRVQAAKAAAQAKSSGLTRAQYREQAKLSAAKADECWRDADVLFREA